MIRLFTLIILFLGIAALTDNVAGQANPSVAILPLNTGGIVALSATMDVKVTINNTLSGTIPAAKLRPVITIPAIATILPDAQQTGLPPGWTIVSNVSGSGQIRVCNGSDPIGGNQQRDIVIKVQGTTIGGPTQCQVQLNFGGVTCAVSGPQPSGNNTVDDFATSSITVVPGCSLSVSATGGIINCNGGTTIITAVVTNAPGPVEYSITGAPAFQTSNVFNNVPSGSYTVTAREIASPGTCVAVSSPLVISEPAPLPAPVVNIIQPGCALSAGIMNITSNTINLTFSIDGSSTYNSYSAGISLPPGSHTVRAKNINDCLSPITTFIINAQPLTPTPPLIGTVTQPDCNASTGSVNLNGLPAGNWVINPGTITGNTGSTTVNSLAAGTYNFTVTNDQGCTSAPTANVIINAVPGAPAAPIITTIQPTCTVATGSIIITSPTVGLTFSLDGGSFQGYPSGGFSGLAFGSHSIIAKNTSGCLSPLTSFIINAQPAAPPAPIVNIIQPSCTVGTGTITITSPTINNTYSFNNGVFAPYPVGGFTALPGTYSIAAQNSNGCSPSVTNGIIVNPQPASPTATLSATTITCSGQTSALTVLATGAVPPYLYSLNNGAYQTSNTFNVVAGNYTVTVKDANGCTAVTNNSTITQPAPISATISATAIACNAGSSTLTVLASGGTGSFEYSLNNGIYQPGNIFNVIAGTYSANVRSISNPACSATTALITVSQPAILKATSSALAISYCGGTAVVKVTATGGTLPYTGTGDFSRGPGKWSFIVTDAKGCTSSTEVIIMPPGCLDLKLSPNPAQNLITVNHSAALSGSAIRIYATNGGMVLYKSVSKSAFISLIDISTLASGVYLMVFTNGGERKEAKFIKTNKQ